ncbi:MAG TPA: SCO family protein [Chloroflexi bacterium]|nr:SCO family protein [Chloroflexota bacterium]HHW86578.1 SCO family protein [Chloroflexota bacterium]
MNRVTLCNHCRRHQASGLLVAALLMLALSLSGCSQTNDFRGTPYDPVIPAPEISGVNLDNTPFTLSGLQNRVKVVFFGYTFCPDICPLTLANMKGVAESLTEAEHAETAFIFVSFDPARDTPDRLASYVGAFNKDFYGLYLQEDELTRVKKDYGVYAEKRVLEASQSAADYLIDHTAFVYIIDKENNLREIFPHDAPKGDIAADIANLVGR